MNFRHKDKSHISDHLRLIRLFLKLTDPGDGAQLLERAEQLANKSNSPGPDTPPAD